jgi:hypothetical protein
MRTAEYSVLRHGANVVAKDWSGGAAEEQQQRQREGSEAQSRPQYQRRWHLEDGGRGATGRDRSGGVAAW